ncbi:hypothetical protein Efla_002002 [Eimeria flavescens]
MTSRSSLKMLFTRFCGLFEGCRCHFWDSGRIPSKLLAYRDVSEKSSYPEPSFDRPWLSACSANNVVSRLSHIFSLDVLPTVGRNRDPGSCVRTRALSTVAAESPRPERSSSSSGLSYSQFVRKCSEWLTDRQLERVAMRLKIYKALKKPPRPHSRLAVVRDQDEVGDGIPQSIMGDYTVGAQLLRTREAKRTNGNLEADLFAREDKRSRMFDCASQLAEDSRGCLREIASRPPTPTRLTEARE